MNDFNDLPNELKKEFNDIYDIYKKELNKILTETEQEDLFKKNEDLKVSKKDR